MSELRGYRFVLQALERGVTVIAVGFFDVVAADFEDAAAMARVWASPHWTRGSAVVRICGVWALEPGERLYTARWFSGAAPSPVEKRFQYSKGDERLEEYEGFSDLVLRPDAWLDDRPEVDRVLAFRGDIVPGRCASGPPKPGE